MFIRWICVVLLLLGVASTARAEPSSSTDKIVNAFMELDTDNNNGVSHKEYMDMVEQRANTRFQDMDANRDKEVSSDEYREFWRQHKAQWYRLNR